MNTFKVKHSWNCPELHKGRSNWNKAVASWELPGNRKSWGTHFRFVPGPFRTIGHKYRRAELLLASGKAASDPPAAEVSQQTIRLWEEREEGSQRPSGMPKSLQSFDSWQRHFSYSQAPWQRIGDVFSSSVIRVHSPFSLVIHKTSMSTCSPTILSQCYYCSSWSLKSISSKAYVQEPREMCSKSSREQDPFLDV